MPTSLDVLNDLPKWEASAFSPLEVPQRMAEALGNPQDRFRSIHVAGTNGKGSVCAFLAAALHADGKAVGQFVSPHLSYVTERCLLAGQPVDEATFAEAVQEVLSCAKALALRPSYFVVTMLASFLVFAQRGVDWAVIEVGLGGSFDATNILKQPELSVITRIGYDHMHWLGEDLATIAKNKAGIIKAGVPVVLGANEPVVQEVCRARAEEVGAKLFIMGEDFALSEDRCQVVFAESAIALGLNAVERQSFHAENRTLAAFAAQCVGIGATQIAQAAAQVCWPGRTELLHVARPQGQVAVLLDGLHNPQGAEAFVGYLRAFLPEQGFSACTVVVSIRSTKRADQMLGHLAGITELFPDGVRFIATGEDIQLAEKPEVLQAVLPGAECIAQSREALTIALDGADAKRLVLVVGSLYLLGALRPLLTDEGFQAIKPQ